MIFPANETSIYGWGFSMTMLNNQMVQSEDLQNHRFWRHAQDTSLAFQVLVGTPNMSDFCEAFRAISSPRLAGE